MLNLVATAGIGTEAEPWLARLPLPDGTGERVAADELLVPDSPVLGLLDVEPAEHTVAEDLVRRWGVPLLLAVGVREGFPVVRDADVPLDEHCQHDLDDERGWVTAVVATLPDQALPPILLELTAVRDLDLVRDDAWPAALATLAVDPTTRPALVDPAHVQLADGSRRTVPAYTVWWLGEHAFVAGRRLGEYCAPTRGCGAARFAGAVGRRAGSGRDPRARTAVVAHRRRSQPAPGQAGRPVAATGRATAGRGVRRLGCNRPGEGGTAVPHPGTRTAPQSRLVDPDEVIVAAGPQWLQLGLRAVVPGPDALADVLGVESAADVSDVTPDGGVETPVPVAARLVLPTAPRRYLEHDDLVVAGQPVDWWVGEDGLCTRRRPTAWPGGWPGPPGRWDLRFVVAEVLRDPSVVPQLLAEQAFD